jgi:hypothetical protein
MEDPLQQWVDVPFNELDDPEYGRWLNLQCRCFGDKGDVEDITEGQCSLSQ